MIEKNIYSHKKFKISIKSWIVLRKVHKIFKFNQNAWLKSYIDINTELKNKKCKN